MTIGKFSEKTSVSCSALRYYEAKGLILVSRDFGNRRIYAEQDIEWIKFLQRLKHTGMSLKEMKRYSDLRYKGKSSLNERLEILNKHQNYVEEQCRIWEEYAKNLQDKIEWYQKQI